MASVSSDRSAQDRSKAKPDQVVRTPVARLSSRASSRATSADAVHASTTRVVSGIPRQSADTSGWSPARFISSGAPVRGTLAQPGRGCPSRDRERGSGRIPGSDVVHRDAAVLNGSDRRPSDGAPSRRMTPNGSLGSLSAGKPTYLTDSREGSPNRLKAYGIQLALNQV
jgi:hypothetical protein